MACRQSSSLVNIAIITLSKIIVHQLLCYSVIKSALNNISIIYICILVYAHVSNMSHDAPATHPTQILGGSPHTPSPARIDAAG